MSRFVCLLVVIFSLTACANRVPPEPLGAYDGEPKFHSVSVYVWGFEDLQPLYNRRDYFPKIKEKILTSGLFMSDPNPGYSLDIKWMSENKNPTRSMVSGIARAFTLFVVPDKNPLIHTMQIDVYHGQNLIRKYSYKEEIDYWHSIFSDNHLTGVTGFNKGVDLILKKFFKDLESDQTLAVMPGWKST